MMKICDSIAHLLNDVCVESGLQSLTGEDLSYHSTAVDDGTCLDIAASGLWSISHQPAYFGI